MKEKEKIMGRKVSKVIAEDIRKKNVFSTIRRVSKKSSQNIVSKLNTVNNRSMILREDIKQCLRATTLSSTINALSFNFNFSIITIPSYLIRTRLSLYLKLD